MFPRRIFLRGHPRHRFRVRLRHRRLQRLQPVLRSRNQRRKRIIPHDSRVIGRRQFLLFRGLPDRSEHPQRVIRLAVQRIAVHKRSQSRSSRPFVPSRGVVKIADAIISLRQHFLHFPQILFRFRRQWISRILLQEGLEGVLGLERLRPVAVRLFHLTEMRHGHLQLRVRGFRQHREEHGEVCVRLNGLRGVRGSALFVKRIRNRQLCFGQVFAVRIGIDQRLHV